VTKTVDELISEDFFFTLPYYCNAPESYMRQKVKELVIKFLEENKEWRTEPNLISGVVTIHSRTGAELLSLVSDSTSEAKKQ